jgi:hypothetical protein
MIGSFDVVPLSDDADEGRRSAALAFALAFFALLPDRAGLLLEAVARFEALEPLAP